MEIKKMVVGYDGSESSRKAVEWAVSLGSRLKNDIVVASVVRLPEFSPSIDEIDEAYADGEKYYRSLLEKIVEYGEEQGVLIRTKILRGHPAESIVRYAFDQKADLIVMGTRGMGGFKNLIIGSVAQKVVSYSKVPVVIIK
jgi:nucleotide-binding universal stress UspA family protein